jgi:hypothetical protein
VPVFEPHDRCAGPDAVRPRPEARREPASGEGDGVFSEHDHPAFDRLAAAVLASPSAPLGPLLRAQLPGTTSVRWLRQEQLPPTTRPAGLTGEHWLSLFACWSSAHRVPTGGGPGVRRSGGRPSTHGHASGAGGRPRWGQ